MDVKFAANMHRTRPPRGISGLPGEMSAAPPACGIRKRENAWHLIVNYPKKNERRKKVLGNNENRSMIKAKVWETLFIRGGLLYNLLPDDGMSDVVDAIPEEIWQAVTLKRKDAARSG